MSIETWVKELPISVTVCDNRGIILEMNQKAAEAFKKEGGLSLLGSNLLGCHPEPARSRVQKLLESGERNVYMIVKEGRRKLIYQTPWFDQGSYKGFVELALEIPADIPTFVRK